MKQLITLAFFAIYSYGAGLPASASKPLTTLIDWATELIFYVLVIGFMGVAFLRIKGDEEKSNKYAIGLVAGGAIAFSATAIAGIFQ
jgi:formate-dependent nitrite reductase membrane component NrfD